MAKIKLIKLNALLEKAHFPHETIATLEKVRNFV